MGSSLPLAAAVKFLTFSCSCFLITIPMAIYPSNTPQVSRSMDCLPGFLTSFPGLVPGKPEAFLYSSKAHLDAMMAVVPPHLLLSSSGNALQRCLSKDESAQRSEDHICGPAHMPAKEPELLRMDIP